MGISLKIDPADTPEEVTNSLQLLILMTVLTLVPSVFIMTTSFMRIMIVFGFLRRALGTQTAPANQVLAGMSLFLTIFIMAPVWTQIHEEAFTPYLAKEITQQEALKIGSEPLRVFMARQTGEEELALFVEMRKVPEKPEAPGDIPLDVLIPAFMLSELKTAFQMGFLIYLPFLVIDLVISSALMSMGMMMLPPMMISLPIKILFFVLADGWTMMIRGLVSSFSV
ncbi:MAG: flagellar biosynthetic protein FliP [Spartobacteria bacterium]|nr:flagellar biosynthetic protein FliP [Spartobacteria bacterium]